MSERALGVLVSHGKLAQGLLDALQGITGSREDVIPLDNEGLTPEALEQRLADVVAGHPAVVFVDLPSGSCAFAARRLQAKHPRIAVVCGVNLPLLLDFVFHRDLSLAEIVDRLRAHTGISIEQGSDADSSVPR